MDPVTLAMMAAAAPAVIGMFQDKPSAPVYRPPEMPDRSKYYQQLLDMAYNPNNRQYLLASDQVANQVNRALARQGLAGSSMGGQLAGLSQANLANSFIDKNLERANQAFQTVGNYDAQRANIQAGLAAQIYQGQRDQYQGELANQAGVRQGIGSIANAGMYAYGQGLAEDRYNAFMDKHPYSYGYQQPSPYYGVPAPAQLPAYQPSYYGGLGSAPPSPFYSYGQTPGYGGIPMGSR
jgi:hypothetical protein